MKHPCLFPLLLPLNSLQQSELLFLQRYASASPNTPLIDYRELTLHLSQLAHQPSLSCFQDVGPWQTGQGFGSPAGFEFSILFAGSFPWVIVQSTSSTLWHPQRKNITSFLFSGEGGSEFFPPQSYV